MTSFRTFGDWRTIKELGLSSRAKEVSYEEARQNPHFEYALELHGLWLLMPINAPGDIPHYAHVRPNQIGSRILPSMFVMDAESGGKDFRWRLFGTDHAQRFGGEVTGRRMTTIARFEPSAASSLEFARKAFASKSPVFFTTEYFDETGTVKSTCTVALPLSGDGGNIERIFGCSVWC
jgi:hypothetical protein